MAQHTSLPMQSLSVDGKNGLGGDEKYQHDPINGHARPSVGTPGLSGMGQSTSGPSAHSAGILPGGGGKAGEKKKVHPAVIIALWIALSSSVIVYNK